MGVDAARKAAGLKPMPTLTIEPQAKADPKAVITEDATIGNEERLRGIPAVGRVSGTIKGTRPGDPSYIIEEANRELHAAAMRRARQQLRRPHLPEQMHPS